MPKCIENGCTKRPCYNLLNEKKAIYCNEHKQINMSENNTTFL